MNYNIVLDKLNTLITEYRIRASYGLITIVSIILMGYAILMLVSFLHEDHAATSTTYTNEIALPLANIPAALPLASDAPAPVIAPVSSNVDLTVTGITYSKDSKRSRAIIRSTKGQKNYPVNAAIEEYPELRVAQIHPTQVILNNGGSLQTLELESPASKNGTTIGATPKLVIAEIDTLGKYIKATIIQGENNNITGIRLHNNVAPTTFRKSGLIPADVAIKMNNHLLQDKQSVDAALTEMEQLRTAEFTVLRNGQQLLVKVSIQDFISNMDVK